MKSFVNFFSSAAKLLPFLLILISILFFQAQFQEDGHFNDDDPLIEQPTRESYSHLKRNGPHTPQVITVNNYDNYETGIDNWEEYVSINPLNPHWIFTAANASPQNARASTNAGINWYLNNPSYPGGVCCDPWAAHTGSGVLVYASGVNGQYVYRSTNNGLNWGPPILSVSGNDRNIVACEETGNGPYANYCYAAMTPGNFGRSTDAGLTWTQTFTTSNTLPGCYIAVGPNDTTDGGCVIYITNTGSTPSRIYNFFRSTNGGTNFTNASTLNVAGYVGSLNTAGRLVINGARTNPHPKIAMDNSHGPYRGRLYLVYATNDPPGNGMKPDIWLQYSTDQGSTWSARTRVNDNPNPELSDQWFPEIWCEKTTGILYIHWYDDRSGPATYNTEIYATYSTDGGVTFQTSVPISNTSWVYPQPACSPNTNCYRGDYTGVSANPLTSFHIWGDPRNGTALNMGAYFPDFAMRVLPNSDTITNISDSSFYNVSVPGVKLWNKTAKFSVTVNPLPAAGNITTTLMDRVSNNPKDSLTVFPDSLKLRIRASGSATPGVYTVTVKGEGKNGTPVHLRTISLTVTNPVSVSEIQQPVEFSLKQNYPNPFNPVTKIEYELPVASTVILKVYNALGEIVVTLVNERQNSGSHIAEFNAEDYPSGVYFYKLEAGSFKEIKSMILLK